MAIFKSLGPDDISRVPFNANKQFSFSSASAAVAGITVETFEYDASNLNTISSASTDSKNTLKYYQLDHLFYKDYRLDISNKLGDADYLLGYRTLYNKANVLSIPSNLFGNQIKPGTFIYSSSNHVIIDDKKGNLIISGTQLASHSIDERERVLHIEPVKGFKQYDVNFNFYGHTTPNPIQHYNKENIYDDSYYYNLIEYKNVLFSTEDFNLPQVSGSKIEFGNNNVTSSVVLPHNEIYNFNTDEDFAVSFHVRPVSNFLGYTSSVSYLVSKSTTKKEILSPVYQQALNVTGSSQPLPVKDKPQFPFEIFMEGDPVKIKFRRSDGTFTPEVSTNLNTGSLSHVVCMRSASKMEIWVNGVKSSTTDDTTVFKTGNKSDLYIGSKGETDSFYTGSISNLMIFNSYRTNEQIKSISSSLNGSPYVGNIFYSNGISTITHLKHQDIFLPDSYNIFFKNIHPIYENEYMCTINADEFNYTHNISTRVTKTDQHPTLANFATGSLWKPYVTTVGLFNENNELLVVGKLGQPVRMSDETDTTFVLRWDT